MVTVVVLTFQFFPHIVLSNFLGSFFWKVWVSYFVLRFSGRGRRLVGVNGLHDVVEETVEFPNTFPFAGLDEEHQR